MSAKQILVSLVVSAGLALTGMTTASHGGAAAVVSVTLTDAGLDANASMPMGLGMAVPMADASAPTMIISASPAKVPSGSVTFVVTNASANFVHEMIVAAVDPTKPLPYLDAELRVNEDAAQPVGEMPELDPGKAGQVTFDLDPGKYLLFCNMPGHYMAGMWTLVTVE